MEKIYNIHKNPCKNRGIGLFTCIFCCCVSLSAVDSLVWTWTTQLQSESKSLFILKHNLKKNEKRKKLFIQSSFPDNTFMICLHFGLV